MFLETCANLIENDKKTHDKYRDFFQKP